MKSETEKHIEWLLSLDDEYKAKTRKSESLLVDKFASIVDYFENQYGLESSSMSKAPNKRDLLQFELLLNELPKDIPLEAKKRVKQYKKLIGIDRKMLLGGMVGLVVVSQTTKHASDIDSESRNTFISELDRLSNAYDVSAKRLKNRAQDVVDEPIGSATWQDRIWQHADKATSLIALAMTNTIVQRTAVKKLSADISSVVHAYNSGIIANYIGESAKANGMAECMFGMQTKMKMVLITQPNACDICSSIADTNPYTAETAPTLPIHGYCRCEWSFE